MAENLQALLREYSADVVRHLPVVAGVLGLLIGGWIAALVVQRLLFAALSRTELDQSLARLFGFKDLPPRRVERAIARTGYYAVLGMTLIALLDFAGLDTVTRPLLAVFEGVAGAVPNLLKALVLGVVGYLAARLARSLTVRLLDSTGVVARLEGAVGDGSASPGGAEERGKKITRRFGNVVYWVVLAIACIPVLEALQVGLLATPLSAAFHAVSVHVPRIAAALLLGLLGYVLGRVVRVVLRAIVDGLGVDRWLSKIGLGAVLGSTSAGHVVGTAAMAFVLLHFGISAVGRLGIDEISEPLGLLLTQLYAYLPKLVVAALLTAVAVVASRVVSRAGGAALRAVGFDRLMSHVGVGAATSTAATSTAATSESRTALRARLAGENKSAVAAELIGKPAPKNTPAGVAGLSLGALVFLSFAGQVLRILELTSLAALLDAFLAYLPHVLVALCVVAFGSWAGSWAKGRIDTLTAGSDDPGLRVLGNVTRVAVVVVSAMVALQQLGVGRELITVAFTLVLGAVALAGALAFGLGGREWASELLRQRRLARRHSSTSTSAAE